MKSKASFIHERGAGHTFLHDLVLVWVFGFLCFSTTGFSQQLNQSPPAPAASDTSTQTDSKNLPATTSQTPVPAPVPAPTRGERIKEEWLIGLDMRRVRSIEAVHRYLIESPLREESEFLVCWISGVGKHGWTLAKNGEMKVTHDPLLLQNNEFQELDTRGEWSLSGDTLTLKMSQKFALGKGAIRKEENSLVELKIEQCEHKITEDELQKRNAQWIASGGFLGSFQWSADGWNNAQKDQFDFYCVNYQSQIRAEFRDVNGKVTVSEGYRLGDGKQRNLKHNGPPFFIGRAKLQANSESEITSGPNMAPTPVTTPSPTTTPTPVATNTPSGREAIKEALRRDPEFAKMTDEQLDSFLDKIDHASLLRWTLADSIKAEKEYWESIGADPYPETIIRPATPTPPTATIKTPYDWIRHFQKEAELAKNLQQINNRIKDGLDADREIREARDNLRRQLEMLRNVRNQAMRNPSLYVPRPPVRR